MRKKENDSTEKFSWQVISVLIAVSILLIPLMLISIIISGCDSESDVSAKMANIDFDMKEISCDRTLEDFYLYEDTETHIQYIVYKDNSKIAITPRYLKADGTLYTEAGTE